MSPAAMPPAAPPRPAAYARPSRPPRPPRQAPPRASYPYARRTLLALLACMLSVLSLKTLFSDDSWLADAWITMLIVIGPAALMRLRRSPGALDIWPGIVLLVPWLTARFVHEHAIAGLIPTGATLHDVSLLMTDLHETTRNDVAPIDTTVAVRLVVCALVGLLAALVDLIAVVGRRGALAGVPLLVVYTVAGAVPRATVSWLWFIAGAVAYLLLLTLDARDDLDQWGRRIGSRGSGASAARTALSVSAPRIAVVAVAVAVLIPLIVPTPSHNIIADAFHDGGGNGDSVGDFGASGGGKINPFAELKGQLDRGKPADLATVHVASSGKKQPYYLKVNVLSKYTPDGWKVDDHGSTLRIADDDYPASPPASGTVDSVPFEAQIKVVGLRGYPPVFAQPRTIEGLGDSTTWSPQDQILLGSSVDDGLTFTERFDQPDPTAHQLDAATGRLPDSLEPQLAVPQDFPGFARDLVAKITAGKSTPYAKARALNDYFVNPVNGFVYDLKTKVGDSGSALVDFLKNKRGFCQQYAAAMAIMLRSAGVPARVALGYMHPVPDSKGNFTVTTSDAHSWVEAYFAGIGWVPFDPTPASGLDGGTTNDLGYAPHTVPSSTGGDSAAPKTSSAASSAASTTTAPPPSQAAAPPPSSSGGSGDTALWVGLGVLAVAALLLAPALTRAARRRRRYLTARRDGDASALWDELSDTATDLGYSWSAARSPRQVATWLGRDAPTAAPALHELAVAVERQHYAHGPAPGDAVTAGLADGLRAASNELRTRRSGRTRLRALIWPASLRWTPRLPVLAAGRTRAH